MHSLIRNQIVRVQVISIIYLERYFLNADGLAAPEEKDLYRVSLHLEEKDDPCSLSYPMAGYVDWQ